MLSRAFAAHLDLFRQARWSRRDCWLAIVLCGWGWGVLDAAPVTAQSPAAATITGQVQQPQVQYGLSAYVEERRSGQARVDGVLVMEFYRRDDVLQVRTDIRRGVFVRDDAGEIVGACLEGKSHVAISDGTLQSNRRTRICFSADTYEFNLSLRDGSRLSAGGMIDVGENRFFEGLKPAGLIAGVGESTDRDGRTVRLAMGSAATSDGTDMGGAAAAIISPTEPAVTIEADLNDVQVQLSRRGEVAGVILDGLAFVEHAGQTCTDAMSAAVSVDPGLTTLFVPSCGVAGESQANRRYLYFAKVAD